MFNVWRLMQPLCFIVDSLTSIWEE